MQRKRTWTLAEISAELHHFRDVGDAIFYGCIDFRQIGGPGGARKNSRSPLSLLRSPPTSRIYSRAFTFVA